MNIYFIQAFLGTVAAIFSFSTKKKNQKDKLQSDKLQYKCWEFFHKIVWIQTEGIFIKCKTVDLKSASCCLREGKFYQVQNSQFVLRFYKKQSTSFQNEHKIRLYFTKKILYSDYY